MWPLTHGVTERHTTLQTKSDRYTIVFLTYYTWVTTDGWNLSILPNSSLSYYFKTPDNKLKNPKVYVGVVVPLQQKSEVLVVEGPVYSLYGELNEDTQGSYSNYRLTVFSTKDTPNDYWTYTKVVYTFWSRFWRI